MTKKLYVGIEVIKILILNWFLGIVCNASISSVSRGLDLSVIGYTFLIMLGTLIVCSIILDILVSFFTPKDSNNVGEWEKMINKNILRNFSYMLSLFFVAVMVSFAIKLPQAQIITLLRIGFFLLVATNNLTKAYYYVG